MCPDIAGVPALATQVDPAFDGQANRHLSRADGHFAPQGSILRPLADLEDVLPGREGHLTGAIDVDEGSTTQEQVPTDILPRRRGERPEPAERNVNGPA